ncbi:reverse transcriptase domain-containing protein [Tanacetum coccineum]
MASWMNTSSSAANNDDNTNNNTAGLANLFTQIAANLNARRANDGEGSSNARQGCNYKTFMASNPKESYSTEGTVGLLSWFKNVESKLNITKCADADKVEYATCLLQGRALTWWNTQVQTCRCDAANRLTWGNFKSLLTEEYCRKDEVKKLEYEFCNHQMFGTEVDKYTARFDELAKMVPDDIK